MFITGFLFTFSLALLYFYHFWFPNKTLQRMYFYPFKTKPLKLNVLQIISCERSDILVFYQLFLTLLSLERRKIPCTDDWNNYVFIGPLHGSSFVLCPFCDAVISYSIVPKVKMFYLGGFVYSGSFEEIMGSLYVFCTWCRILDLKAQNSESQELVLRSGMAAITQLLFCQC